MSSQKMALGFLTLSMSLSLSLARPAPNTPPPAIPQPPQNPAAANVPGPKIEFAQRTHDFGHAKSGEPVHYTYYFTNSGDQVLEITHVQPSCGCTTAGDYSKRVEPGQTGKIPIQFNTANFSGQVFKTIAVTSTARNENTVVLQLRGTVWKPIEFIPAYSVLSVPPDAPGASATVRITNNLEAPLVLLDPHVTNPAFTVELRTNVPGKGYEVTISAHRPMATGTVQGQVVLKNASNPGQGVSIPFWANVQPAIMVFPPQITLPPGPLTAKATPTVTIQNNSTNHLALSDAAISAKDVDMQLKEMQPGRVFSAVFTFPPGFQAPQGKQVVFTVKTTNPQMPEIKVPVFQAARPVAPPSLPAPSLSAPHGPTVPAAQVKSSH